MSYRHIKYKICKTTTLKTVKAAKPIRINYEFK